MSNERKSLAGKAVQSKSHFLSKNLYSIVLQLLIIHLHIHCQTFRFKQSHLINRQTLFTFSSPKNSLFNTYAPFNFFKNDRV